MTAIVDKSREQKTAEAGIQHIKDQLGPFVVAAESTRMPMLFTDAKIPGHPIIFVNDAFLLLSGYDRDEVLGQHFGFLLETSADDTPAARVASKFTGEGGSDTEVFYHRRDRTPIWVAIFVTPVVNEAGETVQHFASFLDLSVQKAGELKSRMLIDELNHRVKNTLATVRSIVSQGLRSSHDIERVKETVESRLFALSRSHDLLSRDGWQEVSLADLAHEAMKPFEAQEGAPARFTIVGEDVQVKPTTALALGIALHELATNAVKYGALSTKAGGVRLSWEVAASAAGNVLSIQWQEENGPAIAPPTRTGFGTRVIERGLTHELSAETHLDYLPTGLLCTIDIPAPTGAADTIETRM